MTTSSDSTDLIDGLPDGYAYYLTTDTGEFIADGAVELILTDPTVSGVQSLAGAEFLISKTESGQTLYAVIQDGMLSGRTDPSGPASCYPE